MIAGARNVVFFYKMLVGSSKSNLGCEAGCGLTVSWSDHSRIMVGSCSDRSRIVNDVSAISRNLREILENHFAWQAQYSVMLGDDTCCSAHCK